MENFRGKNGNDNELITLLRQRGQEKVKEYQEASHEINRQEVIKERAKKYIDDINVFLTHEGQRPILMNEPRPTTIIKRVGNRAKDLPVRKIEWEGKGLNEAIADILNSSPGERFDSTKVSQLIYEIKSNTDLKRVNKTTASMLRRGAKAEFWIKINRSEYQSKLGVAQKEEQQRLVSV